MESKVCVNCRNEKTVNATTNRLVTESCGHVKCMQCLLEELDGCVACKTEGTKVFKKIEPERKRAKLVRNEKVEETEGSLDSPPVDEESTQSYTAAEKESTEETEGQDHESEDTKLKLNTSHVVITSEGQSKFYLCTLCRRKFNARSQVTYHAYCNGQKKPYDCRECKKSFATLSHFDYHMASQHASGAAARYKCKECDASFIQKSKLQRHWLIKHTNEKKYKCKECHKAFNNRCSLRKHGLLHSGERPYLCPHCPLRFRDTSNLNKHIHTKHSSAKVRSAPKDSPDSKLQFGRKHQCLRCAQAFHSRKDLRRHETVHTEQKPFKCVIRDDKCKQPRFRRRDNYYRHLRNTHGIVATPGETNTHNGQVSTIMMEQRNDYNSRDNYYRHLRNTHGIVATPGETNTHNGQNGIASEEAVEKIPDEVREKAKLEVLNPLPPLPEEVIQKHLYTEEKTNKEENVEKQREDRLADKQKHDRIADKTIDDQAIDKKIEDKIKDKKSEKHVYKMYEKLDKDRNCQCRAIDKTTDAERSVIDKSYIIEANNARESVIVAKVSDRKSPSPTPERYVHKIRKANSLSCQKDVSLPPIDARKLVQLVTLYPHKEETPRPMDVGPLTVKDVQTLKNILHDQADKPDVPKVHWRKKRLNDSE